MSSKRNKRPQQPVEWSTNCTEKPEIKLEKEIKHKYGVECKMVLALQRKMHDVINALTKMYLHCACL